MSVRDSSTRGFNDRLEALRGIAALWVAVGHSLIWLSIGAEGAILSKTLFDVHGIQATVARLIVTVFSGAAAVNIFFVLSGFVLCRSLANQSFSIPFYLGFLAKRLFRIVPAFWLSVALVCLYLVLAFPGYAVMEGASGWYNIWYADPLTVGQIVDNATMQSYMLNPNTWTLGIELLASLALPVAAVIIGTSGLAGSGALLALTFLLAWKYENLGGSLVHFLYMFVLGAIVSMKAEGSFTRRFFRILVPTSVAMVLAASAFFPLSHPILADILVSVGAALLIWCIDAGTDHPLFAVLDSKSARFLGRISYSFYLLHFIILYAIANMVLHHAPQLWLARWPLPIMMIVCLVSIVVALPVSALVFTCVEKPMTQAGRRLASHRWLPTKAGS
ncbi:acyltransferase [Burkholderia sp. Bp9143]|uniref:acyltransferase family protein n=1 Tax=Burkholderia sp. Bp9143 TaxID=2184574 RepID=UPI0016277CFC|nr:acyltransferase [Burkholderia sp. Bp9143]